MRKKQSIVEKERGQLFHSFFKIFRLRQVTIASFKARLDWKWKVKNDVDFFMCQSGKTLLAFLLQFIAPGWDTKRIPWRCCLPLNKFIYCQRRMNSFLTKLNHSIIFFRKFGKCEMMELTAQFPLYFRVAFSWTLPSPTVILRVSRVYLLEPHALEPVEPETKRALTVLGQFKTKCYNWATALSRRFMDV